MCYGLIYIYIYEVIENDFCIHQPMIEGLRIFLTFNFDCNLLHCTDVFNAANSHISCLNSLTVIFILSIGEHFGNLAGRVYGT